MSLTREQKDKLVEGYNRQRPRMLRGAQVATGAGALVNFANRPKLTIPAAIIGGAAGVGDRLLEEKAEKAEKAKEEKMNKNAAQVSGRPEPLTQGAEARNIENYQGILENLFSSRARKAAQADAQLGSLFPADKDPKHSYGRTTRAGLSAREASKRVSQAFGK